MLEQYNASYVRSLREAFQAAREFARRYVAPVAIEVDQRAGRSSSYFPWNLLRSAAPYQLLSCLVPTSLKGLGRRSTHLALMVEELAAACAGVASVFFFHHLAAGCILGSMNPDAIQRYLGEVVKTERSPRPTLLGTAIMGRAQTEAEPDCTATRSGEHYRLKGQKAFVVHAPVAKYIVVLASVAEHRDHHWTLFLVPTDAAGVSLARIEHKIGQRACPEGELHFDDVKVPVADRLGLEGEGREIVSTTLRGAWGAFAAISTGIARAGFESVLRVCQDRNLLGERWVQEELAHMLGQVHMARQSYVDACMDFDVVGTGRFLKHYTSRVALSGIGKRLLRLDQSHIFLRDLLGQLEPAESRIWQGLYASIARCLAGEAAFSICSRSLDIAGLEAVARHHELEKLYRDARLALVSYGRLSRFFSALFG